MAKAARGREADVAEPAISPVVAVPGRSLGTAVATAIFLLGLVALFYFLGPTAFFFLAATVVTLALIELFDSLVQAGKRPVAPFGVACGIALMVVAFLPRPALIAVVVAATMFGSFLLALRPTRGGDPASDVAWTLLAVTWVGGGGAGAVAMLKLPSHGLELLIAFVLVAAIDDIAAFFVGTHFGRHKMAPAISPAKSWEGFAAGFLATLGAGAAVGALIEPLTIVHGVAIGAICGVAAPSGDLVASLVKRELGIKDFGRLLPGHGGFLDRIDAIVFCAPAVFTFLRFVVF